MPPYCSLEAWAVHVCLFQSIAVTFGTATSSSIDAGFKLTRDSKLSLDQLRFFANTGLPAQSQTIHYLMVAFNVCTLQIIQQTPTLRDHFQQAAPRMIVLLVGLEMLREVVDPLTQQCNLNLW
jgi:hypothetical protein